VVNDQNPYPGINAHFNSWLQKPAREAMWGGFHLSFLVHLADVLNTVLPEHYVAFTEKSKQLPADLPDDSGPRAVAIYTGHLSERRLDKAVCWIEMIFPQDFRHPTYVDQRKAALSNGTLFIELEFAHESPSATSILSGYPYDHSRTAYQVIAIDYRPDIENGTATIYGFGVGERLPTINISLLDNDTITLYLNAIYQDTFRAGRWNMHLDYTTVPERFDTYSAADQQRILAIMNAINRS
jgi:hypothetical protein